MSTVKQVFVCTANNVYKKRTKMHLSQKILGKYGRRIRSSSDKLALKPSIKSQLFSKWFMGSSISSKKRTNEFVFTLEEIDDLKKPFRN